MIDLACQYFSYLSQVYLQMLSSNLNLYVLSEKIAILSYEYWKPLEINLN